MTVHKFTVKASNTYSDKKVTDVSEHYIAAYSSAQARVHVVSMLEKAGWKIESIDHTVISVVDIRDSCDHITD